MAQRYAVGSRRRCFVVWLGNRRLLCRDGIFCKKQFWRKRGGAKIGCFELRKLEVGSKKRRMEFDEMLGALGAVVWFFGVAILVF